MSPETLFKTQLEVLTGALSKNCFVMGDFNLDVKMEHRNDYAYKFLYNLLTDFTTANNLTQLVNFKTPSRTIKGAKKSRL